MDVLSGMAPVTTLPWERKGFANHVDPALPSQRWRLLHGSFSWDDRKSGETRVRHRKVWMVLRGYLVPRRWLKACWKALKTEDFWGDWMVRGFDAEFKIYAAEYPWAPPFPEVRERANTFDEKARRLSRFDLRPMANRLICFGDSWRQGDIGICVPSAELVEATATRWDGTSGFKTDDGSVVFQDPSVRGGGNGSLWIDDCVLAKLQEDLNVAIVWTVLAGRQIIDDASTTAFRGLRHVSMAMCLDGQNVRSRRCRGEHLLPDRTQKTT